MLVTCAGADVTHPLGFSHSEPSVAAMVGSLDRDCGQFASHVWLQGHRIEMLQVGALPAQRAAASAGARQLQAASTQPARQAGIASVACCQSPVLIRACAGLPALLMFC